MTASQTTKSLICSESPYEGGDDPEFYAEGMPAPLDQLEDPELADEFADATRRVAGLWS